MFAVWDRFPVSPGHALVIPYRHCATWFDATPEEQAELMSSIETIRHQISPQFPADGFNVGFNVGDAAGQTVPHLHIHIIPRTIGDVEDPRGGVRFVIPSKANYLGPSQPSSIIERPSRGRSLVTGGRDPLLPNIREHLDRASAVDIVVAFTLISGVGQIIEHLRDLLERGGRVRFLTGDYLDATDPDALFRLLDLEGNIDIRIFETRRVCSYTPRATSSTSKTR